MFIFGDAASKIFKSIRFTFQRGTYEGYYKGFEYFAAIYPSTLINIEVLSKELRFTI